MTLGQGSGGAGLSNPPPGASKGGEFDSSGVGREAPGPARKGPRGGWAPLTPVQKLTGAVCRGAGPRGHTAPPGAGWAEQGCGAGPQGAWHLPVGGRPEVRGGPAPNAASGRTPGAGGRGLRSAPVRCDRSACLSGCSFRTVSAAATAGGILPCPALPSGQSPPPTHVASGLALPAELGT